jgi:ABC-type Fe3+/spermidine/putrescine transport system ATPase subunit
MLTLKHIFKTYEGNLLLNDISFSVDRGETICLLGSSGSGKSTLLRIIAGIETPDSGDVRWNDQSLASVPAHQRSFGLVFQDYALFPHLNVIENVIFGLRMRDLPKDEMDRRAREVIAQVNLSGFEKRRVTDLSGGEQQRVALARTLAPRPRLLMFDEPLGALDRALREELIDELRAILRREGVPSIYVTHDQQEAFALADRIVILHDGQIVQAGSPSDVHAHPASAWIAHFLGLGNVIDGVIRADSVDTPLGVFPRCCDHDHCNGDRVSILIRPEAKIGGAINGVVSDVVFHGREFRVTLRCADRDGYFFLDRAPRIGETISLAPQLIQCLGMSHL